MRAPHARGRPGALAGWSLAAIVGVVSGVRSRVEPHATLRFLLAVLVLVFARRTYWEFAEWRWRHLPDDDRFGFANPLVGARHGSWEASRHTDSRSVATDRPLTAGRIGADARPTPRSCAMPNLRDFERRLGGLVEGLFSKTFRSGVQPVEIAKRVVREMDDGQAGRR